MTKQAKLFSAYFVINTIYEPNWNKYGAINKVCLLTFFFSWQSKFALKTTKQNIYKIHLHLYHMLYKGYICINSRVLPNTSCHIAVNIVMPGLHSSGNQPHEVRYLKLDRNLQYLEGDEIRVCRRWKKAP